MEESKSLCPVHQEAPENNPWQLPLPPGDLGYPLIGESREFAQDPVQFVIERRAKYGDVFKTNIIGANTIFLTDADANHWIFAGEGKYLQNKWNSSTRRLLGDQCTAMLTGDEHEARRRLLMPHFRHSAMRAFGPTIQRISQRHFDEWAARPGEVVLLSDMQTLVFELIVTLLMGDGADIDIVHLSRLFRRWTAGLSTLPINLPFTTYHRAIRANKALQVEIDKIVTGRKKLTQQPQDILGSLLSVRDEQGQPLSHVSVVHEIHNELFAGHDSTVTVLANLMLAMAQHPAATAQARAEIQTAGLSDPLDLDQLKRLPYLNAVLNEGMRYVTPVQGSFRIMLQDMAYKGYRIPQGWTLMLAIAGTHHNSDIWTAIDHFDPERWLPGREEQKNRPFSYLPFGGGPRICLGANFALAEMRLMLAILLRDYAWSLIPDQDLAYRMIPFPRPKSGIRVDFSRSNVPAFAGG